MTDTSSREKIARVKRIWTKRRFTLTIDQIPRENLFQNIVRVPNGPADAIEQPTTQEHDAVWGEAKMKINEYHKVRFNRIHFILDESPIVTSTLSCAMMGRNSRGPRGFIGSSTKRGSTLTVTRDVGE